MGNHKKTVIFRSALRQAKARRLQTQGNFLPWRVDLDNECLRRGEQTIKLTLKAFAVLRYLVEHTGRLVTKEELFAAVWPQTYVSDGVLKNCVMELRQALGDEAKTRSSLRPCIGGGIGSLPRSPLCLHPFQVPSSRFQVWTLSTRDSALSIRFWWVGSQNSLNSTSGWRKP